MEIGPFSLKDKVALVVGGRGFLGRRFCRALSDAGAAVCSADLPDLSHSASADSKAVSSEDIGQYSIDVTDPASVSSLVDEVMRDKGSIDVLVFSVTAKPDDFYKPYTECSIEGWRSLLRAELDGVFLVTQAVGRVMEKAGRGSIILISSIYGVVGNDQRIYRDSNLAQLYVDDASAPQKQIYSHAGYPAAKGAIISLTRYLAAYWGEIGIRVNCISPGGIAHPKENDEFVRRYSERVPLGRKAGPDEVNGAVVFLASDASSYVTGHNLMVDGGWTIW